jgi:hypothetical protein
LLFIRVYLTVKTFSTNLHAGDLKEGIQQGVFSNFIEILKAVPRNFIIPFRYVISQETKDVE